MLSLSASCQKQAIMMLLFIVSCICVGSIQADKSFLVTVPNVVIPGTTLGFHVNILDAASEVTIKASLKFALNGSVVAETSGKASEGNPTLVDLQVPETLKDSTYKVSVTGSGGLNFHRESNIFFDSENFLFIFIQLDKYRYSGGQTVRFRAIFLNPDLHGYTGVFDIVVKDPKDNKLKQWLSQTTIDGVFSGSFSLSDDPETGAWKIEASAKGKTETKEYQVSPYTLPRFKVSIDVDKAIYTTEKELFLDVSARFTFHQPVYGVARLQIYNEDTPSTVVEYKDQIQGHVSFVVPVNDILDKLDTNKNIIARAMVTDEATILTMAAETTLNIVLETETFTVERMDERNTFVPGIKYYASFSVLNGGVRVTKAGNVNVKVYYKTYRLADCPHTTPKKQRIIFSTKTLMSEVVSYSDSGILSFTVDPPTDAVELKIRILKSSDTISSYDLRRILPADRHKMIRLSMLSVPEIGDVTTVQLTSTERLWGSIMFEVYSKGRRITSQQKDVNGETSVTFPLLIERGMIPIANILAYFMDNDGTITSDQIVIAVHGSRINNEISVSYEKETVEVRENIHLSIEAKPGSIVYILAEDERNRLLGSGNDIYLYQVTDKVDNTSYDISDNIRNYRKNTASKSRRISNMNTRAYDEYGDTDDAFIEAGVILFTDGDTLEKTIIANDPTDQYDKTCSMFKVVDVRPPFLMSVMSPTYSVQAGGSQKFSVHHASLNSDGTVLSANTLSAAKDQNGSKKPNMGLPNDGLVRSLFPETWMWESVQVGPEGSLTVLKQVPDSVTSWVTSAFATNTNAGFGIAAHKPKLTVSRDFFVTLDMPATIIYGEEFLLQVTVFNYLPNTHQVVLAITHSDDPTDVTPQATTVVAGEGHSVFAYIKPLEHGDITVGVRAQAGLFWMIYAQDQIERTIYVQPSGVWRETNLPQLIDISSSTFSKTYTLDDHPNMVPGTKVMKLSLTGDFMLPSVEAIEGLQDFLRLPYGCGEQTMIRLGPNIYITEYLRVAGKLTNAILDKSKGFMESGLQRELKYQRADGSFSAFGDRDSSGSTWLTAFVLKCFREAKGFIYIDENIIMKAMSWLLTKQQQGGQFTEPGRVIHKKMQSGTRSDIKLTAFILISLLENEDLVLPDRTRLSSAITRGIQYIESNLKSVRDAYTLSLVCYVMSMGQSSKSTACENKLKQASKAEDDTLHWEGDTAVVISRRGNPIKRVVKPAKKARAKDIEATAYALLFFLSREKVVESAKIVKWLVSQRNARGGYLSTQDTVISLQAISEYASFRAINDIPSGDFGIDFRVTSGSQEIYTYRLTDETKDLLHVHQLPDTLETVTIEAEGTGTAFFQVSSGYFVTRLPTSDILHVTSTITKETLNSVKVNICIRWLDRTASGMIVAEVELPTGFVPDEDVLKSQDKIKRNEYKGKVVNLYFDGLPAGGELCVDVKSDRVDPVVKSQACHVTVYDYYEPENQAMTKYESGFLKSSNICDVCHECNFCDPVLIGK